MTRARARQRELDVEIKKALRAARIRWTAEYPERTCIYRGIRFRSIEECVEYFKQMQRRQKKEHLVPILHVQGAWREGNEVVMWFTTFADRLDP